MKRINEILTEMRSSLERGEQYRRLNDAAVTNRALRKGSTEVWYYKPSWSRDAGMGSEFLEPRGLLPTEEDLDKTHVLLGRVASKDPEEIFVALQGINWSPNGEAFDFIGKKGVHHPSMSVGDVVVIRGDAYMVDRPVGFFKLPEEG